MSLFNALHTLAGQCPAILVTVARDGATNLRVNVMPKAPTGADGKTEVKDGALFTPISLSGSPDELDAGFSEALAGYVEIRQGNHASRRQSYSQANSEGSAPKGRSCTSKNSSAPTVRQRNTKHQ